jgi:hypothetical protein
MALKCPHCGVEAKFQFGRIQISANGIASNMLIQSGHCPSDDCGELVVQYCWRNEREVWYPIFPAGTSRGPVPGEVPAKIAEDYQEACNVLDISPKASAALSRRTLQAILRGHGYKARDLAQEIDLLLNETDSARAIPTSLRLMVDAVRNFGNFSAHPIDDKTTLQVIDVEPEEAEWCLEVIEECFQHFYVRPAHAAARKAALDAKLASAGKPPSK